MIKYLFLTNDSWTVEGDGATLKKAESDAKKKLKNGQILVAWDKYDKDGVSYNNWKGLT